MNTTTHPILEKEEKKTFIQHFSDFLKKYRIILLSVLFFLVFMIAAISLWSAINTHRNNVSTANIEQASDDFAKWSTEQDVTKKSEMEKNLITNLDDVLAKWPHSFASAQALTIKAQIAEEKKDWLASESNWIEAATRFPKSYIAPIALQNAAISAEERGANDKAISFYKQLIEKYSGKSIGIPHAYFSLGRLAEKTSNYAEAITDYELIVSSYPDDDWTKLAKDRIIFLKSQGLSK